MSFDLQLAATDAPFIVSVERLADQADVVLAGSSNSPTTLQATTNFSSWTNLGSQVLTNGSGTFSDPGATNFRLPLLPRQPHRAVIVPRDENDAVDGCRPGRQTLSKLMKKLHTDPCGRPAGGRWFSLFAQQRGWPVETNDESGFVQIFDGKTLAGWQGDTNYWRVEDGELIGEVTPTNLLKVNSFIVWHGGEPRDFELKVEYRISARGNSGINYRSEMATNGPWTMRGYQADIDGANKYTGQNYEENGRTFHAALRGQIAPCGRWMASCQRDHWRARHAERAARRHQEPMTGTNIISSSAAMC